MGNYVAFFVLISWLYCGLLPYFDAVQLANTPDTSRGEGRTYRSSFAQSKPSMKRISAKRTHGGKQTQNLKRRPFGQRWSGNFNVGDWKTVQTPNVRRNKARVHGNVLADQGLKYMQKASQQRDGDIVGGDKRNVIGPHNSQTLESIAAEDCCNVTLRYANCSKRGLTKVPTCLPVDILRLDLSRNKLDSQSLFKDVFANFSCLTHLNMSINSIQNIPEGTFNGLSHLIYLDLLWNKIKMDRILNGSKVFQPLAGSLETLYLEGNNKNTSDPDLLYPEYALSFLENLKFLFLDGLMNKTFGKGFAKMKSLHSLILRGYYGRSCNLTTLTKHTFEHLSVVKTLAMDHCQLNKKFVDKETFSPLKNLVHLDISNNYGLSFKAVGKLMFGLRNNKNFKHIEMNSIGTLFAPCVIVFKDYLVNFMNTSLESLEARNNGIETIERGALNNLPQTLKIIDLKNNKLMLGEYLPDLNGMTNVTEIDLDIKSGHTEHLPQSIPTPPLKCSSYTMKRQNVRRNISSFKTKTHLTVALPPKLEILSMKSLSIEYQIGELHFHNNNSLKEMSLSGNVFEKIRGPFIGLKQLKKLDLSACSIHEITHQFLRSFPRMEDLNLYQNNLGPLISTTWRLLLKMKTLKFLNLAYNNIFRIRTKFFTGTTNLETLVLSTNRLVEVDFDISKMPNLNYLMLSRNYITKLKPMTMDHIDGILKSNRTFNLDLRFNPIVCDCTNLPFLKWLATRESEILYGNMSDYVCSLPGSQRKYMTNGYGPTVQILQRRCRNSKVLFYFVGGGTVAVIIILIISIAYRFRWSLRYWYYAAKLKISSKQEDQNEEFEYDAFICYDSTDEDFIVENMMPELSTKRGAKLYIHGQSFQAGRMITDNIIMAVRRCRKTLVIVTKNMLASKWCLFELQMARMEAIDTGRNVLIFIFVENITYADIKLDIVSYIKTNVVTGYPPDPRQRKVFWDKLARDIKKR